MKVSIQLIISIFVQVALVSAETTPVNSNTQAPKIGIVMGMTGPAAFHAAAVKEGIMLAIEDLKKDGKTVDVVWEDDQTNPAKALSAVRSISSRGYKLVIGPLWSFQTKAVSPILKNEQILVVNPISGSDINGGPSESILNFSPPRNRQAGVLNDWFKTSNPGKTLILTPRGDWGEIHKKLVSEAVKAAGGQVVAEEEFDYPLETSFARSIVLKYKNKGIDAFFTTGGPADIVAGIKALQFLKLEPKVLSTQDLADAVSLGLISQNELPKESFVVRLQVDPEFSEYYRKKFNKEPFLYVDRGYKAFKKFYEAAAATDGSAVKVAAYLKASGQFDTNGDDNSAQYEVYKLN